MGWDGMGWVGLGWVGLGWVGGVGWGGGVVKGGKTCDWTQDGPDASICLLPRPPLCVLDPKTCSETDGTPISLDLRRSVHLQRLAQENSRLAKPTAKQSTAHFPQAHICTRHRLSRRAQVCGSVRKCAEVCAGPCVRPFLRAQACGSVRKCAEVCAGPCVRPFLRAQACGSVRKCSEVCAGPCVRPFLRAQACGSVRKCAEVCGGAVCAAIPGCASVRKRAEVCGRVRRHPFWTLVLPWHCCMDL